MITPNIKMVNHPPPRKPKRKYEQKKTRGKGQIKFDECYFT